MGDRKFEIKSQRYHFSSEMQVETVTGLENALRVYAEKCKDHEIVMMEKLQVDIDN